MPENIKYTGAPSVTPEEARRTAAIPEYRLEFPQVRLTRAFEEAGQEIGRATGVLGATMGTLGRSIGTLGQTMEGAGTEMFNRAIGIKQLEAETKVNQAAISWELGQNQRDKDFTSKKGDQANSQALQTHLKTSEDERQAVRNSLSSPQEQKMFDQATTRPFIQSARQAASHAGAETKAQAISTSEIKLDMIRNRVVAAKEDADKRAALAEGFQEIDNNWRYVRGANPEQVQARKNELYSNSVLGSAERMSDNGDSKGAIKYLEDNKEDLNKVNPNGYAAVYKKVQKEDDANNARVIADRSTGNVDETLQAKEDRAREMIKRDFPNRVDDVKFVDTVIDRVKSKDSEDRRKLNQDRQNAYDFVDNVWHGRVPVQNGQRPTTDEAAMAVPGYKENWDRLLGHQQDSFDAVKKANARGYFEDSPEARATHAYWSQMFELDKDEMRKKYRDDPQWIDKLPIPFEYRKALESQQLTMLRQGIRADEREAPAKALIKRGLEEGLVAEHMPKNQIALLGHYLSAEIKAWRQDHPQKLPSREDEDNFIKAARRSITQPGKWWGETWPSTMEEYQRDLKRLPNNEYENARKAYLETHKGAPEEEITKAILDAYVQRKLRAESGGGAPVPAIRAVPTTRITPGG